MTETQGEPPRRSAAGATALGIPPRPPPLDAEEGATLAGDAPSPYLLHRPATESADSDPCVDPN